MSKRIVKIILAGTAGLALLGVATGCDKVAEPWRDAQRGAVNEQPADVGTMPDGFSNFSTKCDHGNRVYVIYHGDSPYGSIAVVPQDPTCAR